MFSGTTELALDAKGRLAIPTRHRAALCATASGGEAKVVLTLDPTGCLLLYPEAAWLPIAEKINSLSAFNPRMRNLQRMIIGHAEYLELDASGRILVPPVLRERAGLEKTVAFVGQGNKFELWDTARWDAMLATVEPFGLDDLPAELEGFSL